jgi:uncharacterized protein
MSQNFQMPENSKKIVKLLTQTIKKVVSDQGINPTTKKGNKELALLLKSLSKQPLGGHEQVKSYGEKIGAVIIEISQAKGKNYLDKGVIREISLKNKLPDLGERVIERSQPTSPPSIASTKVSQPEKKEELEPTKDLKPVEEISEENTTQEDTSEDTLEESNVTEDETELEQEDLNVTEDDEPGEETEAVEDLKTTEKNIEKEESEPVAAEEIKESTKVKDSSSMSLKDRLTEDIKLAMKAKDKIRLETVRGIKKAVIEKEVSVRPSGQESLTEEQEIELLAQQAKQRRESIEQYQNAEREDLADKETQELAIIETYLPKQLSDEEIETVLDEIITSTGASSAKDIGKVMGTAMKQLKGKADGKKIQSMVKSKLG